jgi:hypothetical protein
VSLADQLVDVFAVRTWVDDRRPGLPAVHGMGHKSVELGEVNARAVVGELGGRVAEQSLELVASEVDVEPEHARPVEVGISPSRLVIPVNMPTRRRMAWRSAPGCRHGLSKRARLSAT